MITSVLTFTALHHRTYMNIVFSCALTLSSTHQPSLSLSFIAPAVIQVSLPLTRQSRSTVYCVQIAQQTKKQAFNAIVHMLYREVHRFTSAAFESGQNTQMIPHTQSRSYLAIWHRIPAQWKTYVVQSWPIGPLLGWDPVLAGRFCVQQNQFTNVVPVFVYSKTSLPV